MVIRTRKTKGAATKKKAAPRKRKEAKKLLPNDKMHLETIKNIQKQIDDAWKALTSHIKKHDTKAWLQDSNRLMLLLGECRYLQNEYDAVLQNVKRRTKR